MIKFLILFRRNFGLVARPQSRSAVDGFFAGLAQTQHDRIVDVVGIGADNLPQINAVGVVFLVLFQKQFNLRSVGLLLRLADFEAVHTV